MLKAEEIIIKVNKSEKIFLTDLVIWPSGQIIKNEPKRIAETQKETKKELRVFTCVHHLKLQR